ncbi:MAG: PDZ domain-containing protein [Oscillospiraceae bacterium]|nr:PDZ domain-containing protein [Oscillospiraceae bacterium]
MKTKFLSLLLTLLMLMTTAQALPALADEPADQSTTEQSTTEQSLTEQLPTEQPIDEQPGEQAEEEPDSALSAWVEKDAVYYYAHTIADNYFYGVSDSNLLYAIICSTIDNDDRFDLDKAIEAMIGVLGDDFAEYYPAEAYQDQVDYYNAAFYGIGVVLTLGNGGTIIDSVYAGGGGEEAGLRSGDQIVAVDGIDTSTMAPAEIRAIITGEENTVVSVTVERNGEIITVQAVRRLVTESHSTMNVIENSIAYIDVNSFTSSLPGDFDRYITAMNEQGLKNMIIDLRDNGGGQLDAAIDVAKKLIPAGPIGKIKTMKDGSVVEEIYSENENAPDFNILVLINENSASASEFLAMALQKTGRAKLLGVYSYGKGSMQAMIRTITGSGFKFTVGEYFTPDDERVHTIGLTPDIYVANIYTPVDPDQFSMIEFMSLDSDSTRLGIEQRLGAIGLIPDSAVDGIYDEQTVSAIKLFQNYLKVEPTGVVDIYTAIGFNDFIYDNITRVTDVQIEEAVKYFTEPVPVE